MPFIAVGRLPQQLCRQHVVAVDVGVGLDRDPLADDALGRERTALDAWRQVLDDDARRLGRRARRRLAVPPVFHDSGLTPEGHDAYFAAREAGMGGVVGIERQWNRTAVGEIRIDQHGRLPSCHLQRGDPTARAGQATHLVAEFIGRTIDQSIGRCDVTPEGRAAFLPFLRARETRIERPARHELEAHWHQQAVGRRRGDLQRLTVEQRQMRLGVGALRQARTERHFDGANDRGNTAQDLVLFGVPTRPPVPRGSRGEHAIEVGLA